MKTSFRIRSWLALSAVAFAYANGQLLEKPKVSIGRGGDTASGPCLGVPEYSILHGIKVYRVGCGVNPPRPLSAMKPISNSDPNRPVGIVVAWAIIDSSGNVRYPKIIRGLGTLEDAQAINAVRQWKFEPATLQRSRVAIQTNLEVKFP
jgi:hypothetical protein